MSIKTFVESVVQQITIQGQAYNFAHGEKDWQNIFADEQSYPVVYLDEPISNDFDIVSSGAIEEYYPIKMMFLYKTQLDFTPSQHDDEIQKARLGTRKFLSLCGNSNEVRSIKSAKAIEVINIFDANTSGVILSLEISFYNQDSICADFDPEIGFVNLSNSNDTWQHQQINNSNYIIPNTIFEIFDQNDISYGEYSIPSVNGGQVIITVNPCDVATFQNSDGSFIQEISSGATVTLDDIAVYVYDQNENLLGTTTSPSNIDVNVTVEVPTCDIATIHNSDNSFIQEIASGSDTMLDDITVVVSNSNGYKIIDDLSPSNIKVVRTFPDTEIVLKDSDGFEIHTFQEPSGISNDIIAPNGILSIKKSDNTLIQTEHIKSNESKNTNISDSVVTLKDSSGTPISTTNVKATEAKNITAPDGAITVNGSSVGGVKSNSSRALFVKLNGTNSGVYDGVDTINLTSSDAWVRPSGWLDLDTVTNGTNKFSGLFAVYETQKNVCTIQISIPSGTRTINWGDGTTQAALNNTVYTKVYDYSTVTSDVLQDEAGFNYKTVVVNFPLNSVTSLFLERNTTATLIPNARSLNWLDIALDCSTITSLYCSSQCYSNKLQRLRVYNVGATIDGAGANFTQLVSLRVLKFPFEKMQSTNQVFTNYCGDFRDENNNAFNLNLTINIGSLFNFFSNGLLSEFGNVTAPLSTSGQGAFANNYNLKKIGTVNLPAVANLVDFISNCVNLESVVTITITSACTNLTNLGIGNKKCRGFIIGSCAGVTSATNAFLFMTSMEILILTGMTRGFTIDDCNMSATAIDALFTSLGTASGAQTINVRRNPGSATCTPSIATAKGFTVVIA